MKWIKKIISQSSNERYSFSEEELNENWEKILVHLNENRDNSPGHLSDIDVNKKPGTNKTEAGHKV